MLNNETTTLLNNFPEFPGDLPVKNVVFTAVAWVQTLAWELSHAPAAAKKKKSLQWSCALNARHPFFFPPLLFIQPYKKRFVLSFIVEEGKA